MLHTTSLHERSWWQIILDWLFVWQEAAPQPQAVPVDLSGRRYPIPAERAHLYVCAADEGL